MEQAFQKNMELYLKYIRAIHTLSRQMGIKNAHFIQPTPAIGKTLTDEKKGRVGDLSYGPVYQKMADAITDPIQKAWNLQPASR